MRDTTIGIVCFGVIAAPVVLVALAALYDSLASLVGG